MVIRGEILKGAYYDSVTLMIVSGRLNELDGVDEASLVMASRENRDILEAAGLWTKELSGASGSDLVVSLRAVSEEAAQKALQQVDEMLGEVSKKQSSRGGSTARSLEQAVDQLPGARLALISVAGRHAAAEARKALEAGLHVMLFSDNVSLDDERALKELALSKGLFVMGPDCGTAIINGVPLAFANRVARGPVGIVAASGTGLQEVSCLLDRYGTGISQAIGTGGRDVKEAVGGMMFLEGIKALAKDKDTSCIVLISKPPDRPVMERISQAVRDAGKSVVAIFLGGDPEPLHEAGALAASDLEETALLAHRLVRGEAAEGVAELLHERQTEVRSLARKIRQEAGWIAGELKESGTQKESGVSGESGVLGQSATIKDSGVLEEPDALEGSGILKQSGDLKLSGIQQRSGGRAGRKFIRGLYSGGTLCQEAQWILRRMSVPVFSNTPLDARSRLDDVWKSHGHSLLDMGDDAFTSGRPHPMMDFSLRNKRMFQEASDPETAILLFDLVLGHGAHPAPLDELLPMLERIGREAPGLILVSSVTGTDSDPQDRQAVVRALEKANVQVMPSNASAALLAGELINPA